MRVKCPHCKPTNHSSEKDQRVVRFGKFYRRSDSTWVQRFRCLDCRKGFSRATFHPCYRQNKRHKNEMIRVLLCSGVSQRQCARVLSLARKTIVRKFIFLGLQAQEILKKRNLLKPKCKVIEFDDMETFEHTKCKPLSLTLAVEHETRRILGIEVSQMPAKSTLAKIALKKYGPRKDFRRYGRRKLFRKIKPLVERCVHIKSDQNPHYPRDVMVHFPKCSYKTYKGRRGCIVGQGELKKIGFDPIFSLNHTCAMFRAGVNRLFRRTWCTTKKPERLALHLAIYAVYHNENLKTA